MGTVDVAKKALLSLFALVAFRISWTKYESVATMKHDSVMAKWPNRKLKSRLSMLRQMLNFFVNLLIHFLVHDDCA